jgi:hypothetical protein
MGLVVQIYEYKTNFYVNQRICQICDVLASTKEEEKRTFQSSC